MSLLKRLEYVWKHRGQPGIFDLEGPELDTAPKRFFYEKSYDNIEIVRRGVDLIVNAAAEIDVNITDKINVPAVTPNGIKGKSLFTLLNFKPNTEESVNDYRSQLFIDLILTGNCFQYYDGQLLYHLPSSLMEIKTGKKNKVLGYEYDADVKFKPEEIIHTKDNSGTSVYTGTSRLKSAIGSVQVLQSMLQYQKNFFDNGAVPGLILQTPNVLGARIKEKLIADWIRLYNPNIGGKRPMILDGDMKVNPLSQNKFSELEFEQSVESHETKILKALGVPPVLLNSGNNANLRPNIQLFYETTVLPLVAKLISSYERFFAWDMEPDVFKVRALRPELQEAGNYYSGLVNTGIMTINEARVELRLPESDEEHASKLRIPQNIAGSAENPSEGGRPPDSGDEPSDEE